MLSALRLLGFWDLEVFSYANLIARPATRAGAHYKLKQKSVWHVPPNQVEGMLQAVLIQMEPTR